MSDFMASSPSISLNDWLAEAHKDLSHEENCLLLATASLIGQNPNVALGNFIVMPASGFKQYFGSDVQEAFERMCIAARSLYERNIEISNDLGDGDTLIRWIDNVITKRDSHRMMLGFPHFVMHYLKSLAEQYTVHELQHLANLTNFYSAMMFKLASEVKNAEKATFCVEALREFFAVGSKYALMRDFRKFVLEPAIKDVNCKTDLHVHIEAIKEWRTIVAFDIYVQDKTEAVDK